MKHRFWHKERNEETEEGEENIFLDEVLSMAAIFEERFGHYVAGQTEVATIALEVPTMQVLLAQDSERIRFDSRLNLQLQLQLIV